MMIVQRVCSVPGAKRALAWLTGVAFIARFHASFLLLA